MHGHQHDKQQLLASREQSNSEPLRHWPKSAEDIAANKRFYPAR